jgi:HPr kinase/phosphorylase
MESPLAAVAIHGTMVEVFGLGVLLRGGSGSGKSDLALGLVDRGHRLVADDLVEFGVSNGQLLGSCRAGCCGFIEIRGLGVVNLARLYGEQALQPQAPLGLVLTLETVDDRQLHGRWNCQRRDWSLLGVGVTELLLPFDLNWDPNRGRDLPLLVETAVRLSRLWQQGYDGAAELEAILATLMGEESA